MKAGTSVKDVYTAVLGKLRAERSDLEQYFVKTLGFAIGIEFRESSYVVGPKCDRPLKTDMIFSLSLGFQNIPDPKDNKKTYALLLLDTIKVSQNGGIFLSDGMKTKNDVIFYFDAPPEATKSTSSNKKATNGKDKKAAAQSSRSNAVMKSKLRNENREHDQEALSKRREHQKELAYRRREAGLEKYSDAAGLQTGEQKKRWKRFESYPREAMLPEHVKDMKVSSAQAF